MFRSTHTSVLVEDFRFDALVGQHAPERSTPQTLSIDLSCSLVDPDVPDDNLENTFDYVPLIEEIKTFALSHPRRLIETFAEEIAELCFRNARVKTVVVSVRKPNKFPAVASVGIHRTFERN